MLLLLIVTALVVVTGLFSHGDDNSGPFAGAFGLELGEAHEALFRVLQILVVIHVAGVAIETVRAKDPLVPAMFTGAKPRRADEPVADARRAGAAALLVALLAAVAVSASLMAALSSHFSSSAVEHQNDD